MLTVEFSIRRVFGLGVLPNPCVLRFLVGPLDTTPNPRVLRFLVGPLDTIHFFTKLSKT